MIDETKCARCAMALELTTSRMGNLCKACGLSDEAGDFADADESADCLEDRLAAALEEADKEAADLLDSSTGMTEDERRNLG